MPNLLARLGLVDHRLLHLGRRQGLRLGLDDVLVGLSVAPGFVSAGRVPRVLSSARVCLAPSALAAAASSCSRRVTGHLRPFTRGGRHLRQHLGRPEQFLVPSPAGRPGLGEVGLPSAVSRDDVSRDDGLGLGVWRTWAFNSRYPIAFTRAAALAVPAYGSLAHACMPGRRRADRHDLAGDPRQLPVELAAPWGRAASSHQAVHVARLATRPTPPAPTSAAARERLARLGLTALQLGVGVADVVRCRARGTLSPGSRVAPGQGWLFPVRPWSTSAADRALSSGTAVAASSISRGWPVRRSRADKVPGGTRGLRGR